MSDYHNYKENLAFPPQEIKSQDDLNKQGRKSEVLIKALEKCEKLEKQLKIAKEYLGLYAAKLNWLDNSLTYHLAESALEQIKELDK